MSRYVSEVYWGVSSNILVSWGDDGVVGETVPREETLCLVVGIGQYHVVLPHDVGVLAEPEEVATHAITPPPPPDGQEQDLDGLGTGLATDTNHILILVHIIIERGRENTHTHTVCTGAYLDSLIYVIAPTILSSTPIDSIWLVKHKPFNY